LAGAPRAITIARLAEWANGLAAKGFVLAPASALVRLQPTAATSTGTTR
jgi:polysaccharide deacetylase 2 family uncharacterized protein YibQ